MVKLISLGVLSGVFFSATFILNELMSVEGGHWVWSASLRYGFTILFLAVMILFDGGVRRLRRILRLFGSHWLFWTVAGSVGFGGFYALLCYSADFSPGWIVAATWQFTVVASLFVFMLFGRPFPKRIWLFSLLVFLGVLLVNLSRMEAFDVKTLLSGSLPVLGAAFCYPFGNQLVWEARNGRHKWVPGIASALLDDIFSKVLLMTLGSVPMWIVLIAIVRPPAPSPPQVLNTSLVALFSGVFATSIFLFARGQASNAGELAAVDATQSSEVVFALLGGLVFLKSEAPNVQSAIGLLLIFAGLTFFVKYQEK